MWPFSRTTGQSGRKPRPEDVPTGDIQSVAGGISSVKLSPFIADESMIWSSRLTALFAYWNKMRGARCCPVRADIDPLDIPTLLPIVFLVDVEGEIPEFRFRLVGSEFARKYGADITGRTLREVNRHDFGDAIIQDYVDCAREAVPLVSRNSSINDKGIYWKYERILLPLCGDAGHVGMILGGMDINIPLSELTKLDRVHRDGLAQRF